MIKVVHLPIPIQPTDPSIHYGQRRSTDGASGRASYKEEVKQYPIGKIGAKAKSQLDDSTIYDW